MQLVYNGPHLKGVDVEDAVSGAEIHAPHGDPVEVPDELAERLLEQGGWKIHADKPAPSTPKNAPAKSAPKE